MVRNMPGRNLERTLETEFYMKTLDELEKKFFLSRGCFTSASLAADHEIGPELTVERFMPVECLIQDKRESFRHERGQDDPADEVDRYFAGILERGPA